MRVPFDESVNRTVKEPLSFTFEVNNSGIHLHYPQNIGSPKVENPRGSIFYGIDLEGNILWEK